MKHFTQSLRFKVTLLVITVELLIFSGVGVFYTHRFSQEIDNAIIARLSVPGLLMSRGELSFDAVSDKRTMEGLLREPYHQGIVIGLDGQVYFSSDPALLDTQLDQIDGLRLPGPDSAPVAADAPDLIRPFQDSGGTHLTCLSPLRPDGKLTGYLYLKVGTGVSEAEKREITLLFFLGSLATIALTAAVLTWLLNWMVIKRLNELVEIFRRFAQGNYAARAEPLTDADEVATLMRGFNGLAERLEESVTQLRENEHFLETLVEHIPNMLFVKDAKALKFLRFNKAGEQLLGYSQDELLGKNDYDFFPQEQADFFTSKDREIIDSRELLDIPEEPINTRHWGQRLLHTRKIPIYADDGTPLYLLGISEDITDQRKAQEEIRILNQELEQRVAERTEQLQAANQELEAFCYSVSHDLRAPLRHVDGYIELLISRCRDDMTDKGRHYVDNIAAASRRMWMLIDDLLEFFRTGNAELQQKKIDMNRVLLVALAPIQESCDGRAIEWVIGKLPQARGDSALLQQVWANLLDNAVKYTRSREAARIEVGSFEQEGELVFFVTDNGVGFDMKYVDKLFGVFQRLHSQEQFEGTGIGLATVQRIITRHGGRVWAEAEPDRGARFYFSLQQTLQRAAGSDIASG